MSFQDINKTTSIPLKDMIRTPYGYPKAKSVAIKETTSPVNKEVNRPASINKSGQQALLSKPKKSTTDVSRANKITGKRSIAKKNKENTVKKQRNDNSINKSIRDDQVEKILEDQFEKTIPSTSDDILNESVSADKTNSTTEFSEGNANGKFKTISTLAAGANLVFVSDKLPLNIIKAAFAKQIAEKGSIAGMPLPSDIRSIESIITGAVRGIEQAKAIYFASRPADNSIPLIFKSVGSKYTFDWLTQEGRIALLELINKSDGCLMVEQPFIEKYTSTIAESVIIANSAAERANVRLVIFISCPDGADTSLLNNCCQELFLVERCDPNPGCQFAFSVDCVGLRDLNLLGIGKAMCNVNLSEGSFTYHYEMFISSSLKSRIMWLMRGQGSSLEEIGTALSRDKSSIQRKLKKLPPPKHVRMPEGWQNQYLASIECCDKDFDTSRDDN